MPNFLSKMGGMTNGLSAGPSPELLQQLLPLLMQMQQQSNPLSGGLANMMQRRNAMGAPNQTQNSIFNQANKPTMLPQQNMQPNQSIFTGSSLSPQSSSGEQQPDNILKKVNVGNFRS